MFVNFLSSVFYFFLHPFSLLYLSRTQPLQFYPFTQKCFDAIRGEIWRKRRDRISKLCRCDCAGFKSGFDSGSGKRKRPSPELGQGERLVYPKCQFLSKDLLGKPLKELDEAFYDDTFVIVNTKYEISRFHVSRVMPLLLLL